MRKGTCSRCGREINTRGLLTHERTCLAPYTLERLYEVLEPVETPGPLDTPCLMPRRSIHGHKVYRLAWVFTHGELSDDKPLVLHRCDNNPCVQVSHLYAGTKRDNGKDAVARGQLVPPTWSTAAGQRGHATIRQRALERRTVCHYCGNEGSLADGQFEKRVLRSSWARVCTKCGHYGNDKRGTK